MSELSDADLAADFRALFANAGVGIVHVDPDSRAIVALNDAACVLLGRDRATLLTMTSDDLLAPGDTAARDALYAALMSVGAAADEARFRRGDGTDFWARVETVLIRDDDGRPRRTVSILSDVSARRAADTALAEAAERSHLALAAAGAGTWEYSYDPPRMLWSDEVYALYDRDIARGPAGEDEWGQLVHPDDLAEARRLGTKLGPDDRYAGEFRVRRADGGWRWLASRARVIRDAAGKRQRIVGINIDLTERKATETALAAAAARFRSAVEAVEGVLWTNDATGRMTGDQPAWAALTGQTFDAYQGYGWADAVHPHDAQPTVEAWERAVAARTTFVFEHRVRCADRVYRPFAVRAIPTIDAHGEVVEWVGVHTDISERRNAEAELERRVARAIAERDDAWNNARDMLLVMDGKGVLQAANPAWTATLGWPVEATVGRSYSDFVVADDLAATGDALDRSTRGPIGPFETRCLTIAGAVRVTSWTAQPAGDLVYASGRDVTEKRAQQAAYARVVAERDQAWTNSRDILLVFGRDRIVRAASPAWTATLGWSLDEIIGRSYLDFVVDYEPSASDAALADVVGGGSRTVEYGYRHQDGSIRLIQWVAAAVGELVYASGRDVTAERARQAELDRAVAERDRGWNNARDMLLILDHDGIVHAANPAWEATLGWPREALIGRRYSEFVIDYDKPASEGALTLAQRGELPTFENRYRHADGSTRIIQWVAGPAGDMIYASGRDVTRDREAQAALDRAVAERDRAWTSVRDVTLVIDADGIVQNANPAWEATLGWTREEALGRSYLDFVVDADPDAERAARELASREAMPLLENRYRHKDGSTRLLQWAAAPAGDVIYATGRDVTEERARSVELARAQAQLHEMQKLETIGQLTGGVAHDFNNLLTPIIGSLDLLQRRGVGGEREQRLIDGALSSADRAKTLVQRLLAFARRQQLESRPTDLAALVDGMRDLIVQSVGPGVAVEVDVSGEVPPAQVDPAQLELALLNLALNARDAMPAGGMMTIAIDSAVPDPDLGLAARLHARLCVGDTGDGMDPETLRRAVEPFFSTKGLGKGTGLGLSMVHGLAAQSGGRLHVVSAVGEGTHATLWLPAADAPAAEATHAAPADLSAVLAETVLLVDDEEMVRSATAAMLDELGFRVIEAEHATAALALLKDGLAVDLLVTDYLMPDTNGAELIAAARVLRPALPALIVTGYTDTDRLDAALPRLSKPFRQAELQRAVAKLIG